MSNVIYVDPHGTAHTVDQLHQKAIEFNYILDQSFGAQFEKVKQAILGLWEAIKPMAEKLMEFFQGMAKTASVWFEEIAEIDIKRDNRGNWEWLKIFHKQNAECHLRRGSKIQINFINRKNWPSFKRYQRQRRI